MMETYGNIHIQEMPLSSPFFRRQVEGFLGANGLRMEALDAYYTLQDENGVILAGAGLAGEVIKCVAVAPQVRSSGLVAPLVSHILSQHRRSNWKVFTKPENEAVFSSLGFHVIARAPEAVLMEKGRGLEQYCTYLRSLAKADGRCGVVVMNANPFTLGHRHLLEKAACQVDTLYVIGVKEDVSRFPYAERLAMIRAGAPAGVIVTEGSAYQISAATFPTYFLKDLSDAAETQMRLDLDLFARHIVPALGVSVRFVGSEPEDTLTDRFNALMKEVLPMDVVEIPRLSISGPERKSYPVSASSVRTCLDKGLFRAASALCPATTWPYLSGDLVNRALQMELDLPLKPGLVCPDSVGAHPDMDYPLMCRALSALRPYWPKMALASSVMALQALGVEAEQAMLKATGGVNTHRGAIFALGITLYSFTRVLQMAHHEAVTHFAPGENTRSKIDKSQLMNEIRKTAMAMDDSSVRRREGVKSAREMAEAGYTELFSDWLPFYRRHPLQQTLLRIMSTLDDTCVIKRVGKDRAAQVKKEAKALLEETPAHAWNDRLKDMCRSYAQEGISPGGAADMLALTIFTDSITN